MTEYYRDISGWDVSQYELRQLTLRKIAMRITFCHDWGSDLDRDSRFYSAKMVSVDILEHELNQQRFELLLGKTQALWKKHTAQHLRAGTTICNGGIDPKIYFWYDQGLLRPPKLVYIVPSNE